MRLRRATAADLGFVRALTQHPDNAPFIGDDDEAVLTRYLADPAARLMIWETDAPQKDAPQKDGPQGFALFREIGHPSGRVELFRLALSAVGGGGGARFIAALTDFAFMELQAARLWLDASGENLRAHKVYVKAGFTVEGRLRAHWYRPVLNRPVDMVLYGMLRPEWQALRAV